MTVNAPNLERFMRRLHARMVLARAAERFGLGLLISATAALPLTVILLCRGQMAMTLASVMLSMGGLAGLIWGIVKRPSKLAAAIEADGQLKLNDLLGTALAVGLADDPIEAFGVSADDPWLATVVHLAEARCAQLRPTDVLARRWGARYWGGVGLAAALVMALAMLSANPASSDARSSQTIGLAMPVISVMPTEPNEPLPAISANGGQTTPGYRAEGQGVTSPDRDNGIGALPNATDTTANATTAPAGHDNAGAGGQGGTGVGAAKTNDSQPHSPTSANLSAGSQNTNRAIGGRAAAGIGSATTQPSANRQDDPASPINNVQNGNARKAAPWQTMRWNDARQQALEKVRQHVVPGAYQDLVQSYFQSH